MAATVKDLSLARTGNYALLCRNCTGAELRNVTIRGGHDGIHAQACAKFTVRDCDFRTGPRSRAEGCDFAKSLLSFADIGRPHD